MRRWEAAKTDRLNEGHRKDAKNEDINQDIVLDLETLCKECAREIQNNAFVEGVVNTHVTDMVGHDGPILEVQSDNDTYNELLEEAWSDWWADPDINGQLAGPELLSLWIRTLWTCGEFLVQIVSGDRNESTKLNNIHPRRIAAPFEQTASFPLGIEVNSTGRPLKYWIHDSVPGAFGVVSALSLEPREVSAEEIIHGFRLLEAGQIRGVPWLAPALPSIADMHDYDLQVLDAARQAADFAITLYTDHPDAIFLDVNESTKVERRTIRTMPPGWKPMQVQGHQPSTGYVEYRSERLREIGRPVGMPLMTIRLDSSKHNFSSARFDNQNYMRSNITLQGWLERSTLNGLVDMVARESVLARRLPQAPERVRYVWTWPKPPNVDPSKEAKGEDIRLKNQTGTVTETVAARGKTLESHIATLKREKELFVDAGLAAPDEQNSDDKDGDKGGNQDGDNDEQRSMIEEIVEDVIEQRELVGAGAERGF